jgi:RHS repeat-associated protein
MNYPDGASTIYSYFSNAQDKRLQQIKNQTNANALISQFDYAYDPEGQISAWTKDYLGLSPAPQRFDLGYDNADQLTSAALKNATTNALIKQYSYDYDIASNRTSEVVGTTTTTSTPNNVNEIVSQSGGTNRTLTYDPNGSLINDGSSRTFEWDGANRLVAVNYTGSGSRSEFSYDGLSRMVKIVEKSKNGRITSTRKFVWCGMEKCEFRGANDAVTDFIYPQGQVTGTTSYFYTRDHLGSIREMRSTGKKGAIVARFDYDPYGRSTAVISNTLPDFNFTGLYRHSASNLDLAVYRAYDPDLGRWLSRDPIGESGGVNLYDYVGNNSTDNTDGLGLQIATPGPVPTPIPAPTTVPDGGFRYHGNWGGPGWANGGWNPESGLLPRAGSRGYVPPTDPEDSCYEGHDRCIHDCPQCPTHGNGCVRECDCKLVICLGRLAHQSFRIQATAWAFDTFIPYFFH